MNEPNEKTLETKVIDAKCIFPNSFSEIVKLGGMVNFVFMMNKMLFRRLFTPLAFLGSFLALSFISMLQAMNQEDDEDSNELKANQTFYLKDLPNISQKYFKLIISISLPISRFNHQQTLLN